MAKKLPDGRKVREFYGYCLDFCELSFPEEFYRVLVSIPISAHYCLIKGHNWVNSDEWLLINKARYVCKECRSIIHMDDVTTNNVAVPFTSHHYDPFALLSVVAVVCFLVGAVLIFVV
jgi:hypothetical protein